ncbi:MAG TPA: DUF6069 family protein [Acidimicrobiales bacterium]|nr:DUF6069 family protein [Acidimicrobiales bacterium]
MTATTVPSTSVPATSSSPLPRTAAVGGVLAAAAVTAVAIAADAAGVPLEIEGERIPLLGFPQLVLVCTAVGAVLAAGLRRWASSPARTFVRVALALTVLSFVPDLTITATTATKVVLIATHVVAAAIVIPRIARSLDAA